MIKADLAKERAKIIMTKLIIMIMTIFYYTRNNREGEYFGYFVSSEKTTEEVIPMSRFLAGSTKLSNRLHHDHRIYATTYDS